MGENTKISWADHTYNPWIGCTRVSAGCMECYAEDLMADRYGRVTWGPKGERSRTSPQMRKDVLKWNRRAGEKGVKERVFCASLADIFDDHPSIKPEWRGDLWNLIAETQNLIWLPLTKRPENWPLMLPTAEYREPFKNVRLGVTIEDQDALDRRGDIVLAAGYTFGWPTWISYEPAIGPVDWSAFPPNHGIQQIICGGESGTHRRPFEEDWARATRDWCKDGQDVAFFYKQRIGADGKKIELPELDGRQWAEFPA